MFFFLGALRKEVPLKKKSTLLFIDLPKLNWVVVSCVFIFTPILGEVIQLDSFFSDGLKPPTSFYRFTKSQSFPYRSCPPKRKIHCAFGARFRKTAAMQMGADCLFSESCFLSWILGQENLEFKLLEKKNVKKSV